MRNYLHVWHLHRRDRLHPAQSMSPEPGSATADRREQSMRDLKQWLTVPKGVPLIAQDGIRYLPERLPQRQGRGQVLPEHGRCTRDSRLEGELTSIPAPAVNRLLRSGKYGQIW